MKIAYDIKLMRPACVLVAAALQADTHPVHRFDTQDWLLAPTPDMKVFDTTEGQLEQLIKMTEAARLKRKS